MRLKNVPGSQERIEASEYVILSPEDYYGKWSGLFQNDHPIYIEIGMGKGKFITEMALKYPEINFIGIEKFSSVLIRAVEKCDTISCHNLYLLRYDAEYIDKLFARDEISRIYLNFSDPWPKDRHTNRRLTSAHFLEKYKMFLKSDGHVAFKTDNRALFEFSLEQCAASGWSLSDVSYDLHNSESSEDNIMTEYEQKFSSMGNPIFRLVAGIV